jgi:hypothetical protein
MEIFVLVDFKSYGDFRASLLGACSSIISGKGGETCDLKSVVYNMMVPGHFEA